MRLPKIKTSLQDLSLLQDRWKAILDTLLTNPSLQSNLLHAVTLTSGSNTINHKLGRTLIGWRIVRLRGSATIYDTQDNNPQPDLTLQLTSSADVSIDLEIF